jgi:hypothetical protein
MIVFVGHTLLLCSVCLDIDDISNMVVNQERRHFNRAMICSTKRSMTLLEPIRVRTLEASLEHVARARPVTV